MNKRGVIKVLIVVIAGFIILLPVGVLLQIREYDKDQFYVPQYFHEGEYSEVELSKDDVKQYFFSTDVNLVGFDIYVSRSHKSISYVLLTDEGEIVREGKFNAVGNGVPSKVRFRAIKDSRNRTYAFVILGDESAYLYDPPKVRYAQNTVNSDLRIEIDGKEFVGNLEMVPVYKSNSLIDYIDIICTRIKKNLSLYSSRSVEQ